MTKLLRLSIVLSCFWVLFAFSSYYVLDSRETHRVAHFYYSTCISTLDAYPNDLHIEKSCNNERDRILNEWEGHKFSVPFAFALITLSIFWILGFVFAKTSRWVRNGK
jgi:hypothetical protein